MKKKKYYLNLLLVFVLMCAGILFAMAETASAETIAPINGVDGLQPIDEYDYIQYAPNYYLDMKSPEGLELATAAPLHGMANVLFSTLRNYVSVTAVLFYYALDFNLADYFAEELNAIQAAMRASIFEPLFFIGVAGSAIVISKRLLKRDLMGVYGQLLKVIAIFVLSLLVVRDSAAVIDKTTSLTSSIGAQILSGDDTPVSNYAAKATRSIWYHMAHLPWEYAEFGEDEYTEADVQEILQNPPKNEVRRDIIENWQGTAFDTDRAGERVGFLYLYMVPLCIKCTIYVVMAGLLLLFQLTAVLYVLLAPLILILAMFPTYERIIGAWLRKFVEIQISALVLYFVAGILFKVDDILFQNVAQQWGWLVVLTVQVVLYVGVIWKRNELLGAISRLGIASPRAAVNNGVHSAKAAAIRSMAAARMLGVKVAVAQRGVSATAQVKSAAGKATGSTRRASAGRKAVERPVTALATVTPRAKAQYTNGTASSRAYTERVRPTRVSFVQREVIFDFEPHTEPTEAYEDVQVQRPRMDVPEYWESEPEPVYYTAPSTAPVNGAAPAPRPRPQTPSQPRSSSVRNVPPVQRPRSSVRAEVRRNAEQAGRAGKR